jgi:hypothetical protein
MQRDRFELWIDPKDAAARPAGRPLPVHVFINGESFAELVRGAELPHAREEARERNAAGGTQISADDLAGGYLPMTTAILLPSRVLLDEPEDLSKGFRLEAGDERRGKATLFGCTCGISECWFLQARITMTDETVTWSEFGQFHRH